MRLGRQPLRDLPGPRSRRGVQHRLHLVGRRNPRRAVEDEGREDARLVEQELRLQQFELEPHGAKIGAQQEIGILEGEPVGRMLGLGGRRRIGGEPGLAPRRGEGGMGGIGHECGR
jgi:hypothetical protein